MVDIENSKHFDICFTEAIRSHVELLYWNCCNALDDHDDKEEHLTGSLKICMTLADKLRW